jgi:hypothetical protein
VRRNVEPLFKENYRAYDKEEFLLDSDIEFSKLKHLLEKNPKLLKEDPLLGVDYLKIINLIKRKKLIEVTSDEYNPADSIDSTYRDISLIEREALFKRLKQEDKLRRDLDMDDSQGGSDRLQLEDQEADVSVRAAKKREEREKNKLLKQFDALAEQYEKSASIIQGQKSTESAGDLKRKSKKKKEKTLAAKLRLKEKKGGSTEKK